MVHPQVTGYSILRADIESKNLEKRAEDYDDQIFIGRFKDDGHYHLLGHRPRECFYLFSENECASLDLGIVKLPEGKGTLKDLVEGDELKIIDGDKEHTYIYRGFCN